jgi:23S rRNA (cytosine1962-C5)-methyltransferase
VAVNNALFVSGKDFHAALEAICADGFLKIDGLVPAPLDFVGTETTRHGAPPIDPAPFNHPTKMAVLSVRRKDEAKARGAQPPKPKKAKPASTPTE